MSEAIMTVIPQCSPKANYLAYQTEIDAAIDRVLDSGSYILGQQVSAFEQEFASYIGTKYAVGVASGTDAIEIALRACDVGPNDLVFSVSHTAVATIAAIERCGAIPVLVDINPDTYTMMPDHLESAIKYVNQSNSHKRAKAVVPVHLYGQPAEMTAILDIAKRYDLYIIEDCAQAHGAKLNDKKVGTFGDLAGFSFYPTKNLGAFGDGGIVVTDEEQLCEKLIALRQYGWKKRNISSMSGINSRLDELQAAVLRVKLKKLDNDNKRRRKIAQKYTQTINGTSMIYPVEAESSYHVYHQYVIRTKNRDEFMGYLRKFNIGSAIHYPFSVHQQPAYKEKVLTGKGKLENTEKVCEQIVSMPMFGQMTDAQAEHVTEVLRGWEQI